MIESVALAKVRGARLSLRQVRDGQRARERRASQTAVQREVRLVSRRIRDRGRQGAARVTVLGSYAARFAMLHCA